MQDTEVRRTPENALPQGGRTPRLSRLNLDSPLWLVLVAGLFIVAEFTPSLLKMPLGADEITYIAQTSARASQVMLPPVHGRGAGLLAAPVTLLTTSVLAMRVWMALLSGVGLFLAMLSWRGLRQAWVLALAGATLCCIAISQLSGVQAMADWWVALGALAAIGLFLQAVKGTMRSRIVLPLLAADVFFLVLLRPQDAAFVLAPIIIGGLVVPQWRKPRVLVAIFAGIVVGTAEWVGEAFAFYGGIAGRLHLMGQEPPVFGLYFSLPYQLRVLNGPWYCRPGACHGWDYPWLTVWWVALLGLVVLGAITVWRIARGSTTLVVACALSVLASYTLFVPYAAPRYLLPVYALIVIPAADGMAWLATKSNWKTQGAVAAAAFLVFGAVTQHFVLRNEVASQYVSRGYFVSKAENIVDDGVRPPCVLGSPSVAYFAGCGGPWTGQQVFQVLDMSPGGINSWRAVNLPGKPDVAYVRKK